MFFRTSTQKIRKRIGWYPVTTFGWFVTLVYLALLVYVVVKINTELYTVNIVFFRTSILIVGMILLILLWAKITGEQPFCKHKK